MLPNTNMPLFLRAKAQRPRKEPGLCAFARNILRSEKLPIKNPPQVLGTGFLMICWVVRGLSTMDYRPINNGNDQL